MTESVVGQRKELVLDNLVSSFEGNSKSIPPREARKGLGSALENFTSLTLTEPPLATLRLCEMKAPLATLRLCEMKAPLATLRLCERPLETLREILNRTHGPIT